MARKLTLIALLTLFFGSFSYGLDPTYTAKLTSRIVCPNDTVHIRLEVTGFQSINSYQFVINFNPQVLSYQQNINFPTGNGIPAPAVYPDGDKITIIWTHTSPLTIGTNGSGQLITLVFKYNGLSSALAFNPTQCEVARFVGGNMQVLTGSFTDGGVTPRQDAPQARLASMQDATLGALVDTLSYHGFSSNVGAITQRISYDPAKLTFIGVTGTGNLATGFNTSVSNGIITIVWTSSAGKNINFPNSVFKINFDYIEASSTSISFSTGCVIETSAPVTNLCATYINGQITPLPIITSYATLSNVVNAIQGQVVEMPLMFDSMPVNTSTFTININFDAPKLAFIGTTNSLVPVIVNHTGNHITITNSGILPSGALPNGQFLKLRFVYQGTGIAHVNFGTGCLFSNGNPIGVGYTNGIISPAVVSGHNATIATISQTGSGPISVPVTLSDMPSNLGAVTMLIGFDNTKLTYIDIINPYSALVKMDGNIIKVVWESVVPTNLNNVPFVTLKFNYIPGSGTNCSAAVYYTEMGTDFCMISDIAGTTIPSNWNDGGVNVKFKISGTLRYNNPPANSPLAGFTVKLKQGTSEVATVTTTSAGYFEFWAGNGTYTFESAPSASALYFVEEYDGLQVLYYAAGYPGPINNALRSQAADVNHDGMIDEYDGLLILYRAGGWKLSDWILPDWVFGGLVSLNPNVTVSCSDVSNVELFGICSGNITGSNPFVY